MVGTVAWKVLSGGAVVLASMAAERALQMGWTAVTGKKPPAAPEDPGATWGKSLAWAVVSGALIGAARLGATRAAAGYYQKSSGHLPKAIRHKIEEAAAAVSPPPAPEL